MEELKLEKTKKLKRRLGYAAKSIVNSGVRGVSSGTKKVFAFMMLLSSHGISAEAVSNYGDQATGIHVETTFEASMTEGTVVLATLEECCEKYGDDFKLDVSQMEFSMADLELAKGKESETAKKMLNTALKSRTPNGYCTRNSKMTIRKMGWADNLSKEDRDSFEGIVPAWGLLPLLQAGKIGPLTEIRINPEELESKTTPIPLMRVNEAGETKNSHTQFMCPSGAVFGRGIAASPEYHKERGKRQKYGTAHFFADKETISTVVSEMTKSRDDVVLVYTEESKTAAVVDLGKVPQEYAAVITHYQKQSKSAVLEDMLPIDLAVTAQLQLPEDIKIAPLALPDKAKTDKKANRINVAYIKNNGLSNG